MLSDPVTEAFGLIHRHPLGENFWCVWTAPLTGKVWLWGKSLVGGGAHTYSIPS